MVVGKALFECAVDKHEVHPCTLHRRLRPFHARPYLALCIPRSTWLRLFVTRLTRYLTGLLEGYEKLKVALAT